MRVSRKRHPDAYPQPWSDAYRLPVGDTKHQGGTWGAYIEALPKRLGKTMKTIAAESGISRAQYYRWIGGAGVNVDSVMKVAQYTGDALETVMRAAGGRLIRDGIEDDPQLRDIYESDLPDSVKQELVEYVLLQRQQAEDAISRQLGVMIRAHKAA